MEALARWLRAGILKGFERWTPTRGSPQGAVISPLLANIYLGGTYTPLPARKQEIPKDGGKVRVLSIPAIRDRVIQGALNPRAVTGL